MVQKNLLKYTIYKFIIYEIVLETIKNIENN
jgi:hypothetical protein